MRRGFGLIWLVVTVIIVATVGVIAYQAGWSEGFGQHLPAADGTTGVAPYPYYYGYGPHFFGFGWIFGLLFGMWGGRGGYGGWKHHSSGGVPPAIDERMREWHQRAHGEQPSQSPGTPPPPPPTSSV